MAGSVSNPEKKVRNQDKNGKDSQLVKWPQPAKPRYRTTSLDPLGFVQNTVLTSFSVPVKTEAEN